MPAPYKTVPAQVVFQQLSVRSWTARLLTPRIYDASLGVVRRQGQTIAYITERPDGGCDFVIQGGPPGSRRYRYARDLDAAQAKVIAWAGRRFRVPADGRPA